MPLRRSAAVATSEREAQLRALERRGVNYLRISLPDGGRLGVRLYSARPAPDADERDMLGLRDGCNCLRCQAASKRAQRVLDAYASVDLTAMVGPINSSTAAFAVPSNATWHCSACDASHTFDTQVCLRCGLCHRRCFCTTCTVCSIAIPSGRECCYTGRTPADHTQGHCPDCCSNRVQPAPDSDARIGAVPCAMPAAASSCRRLWSHSNSPTLPSHYLPTYLTAHGRGFTSSRVEHRAFPSRRTMGAEIEVCGIKSGPSSLTRVTEFWRCSAHNDGSLPNGGFEVVTAPAQGNYYARQIIDICDALKRDKAWVDRRAGLHVHIGLYDPRCTTTKEGHRQHQSGCICYSWTDLRRLILLWEMLEPALYYVVNEDRRNNSYCVPVGAQLATIVREHADPTDFKAALQAKYWRFCRPAQGAPEYQFCPNCHEPLVSLPKELPWKPGQPCSPTVVDKIRKYLQQHVKVERCSKCKWDSSAAKRAGGEWTNKKRDKGGTDRYLSMNFHSWVHRGTVECRMHHGTVDAEEILRWSRLLARICDTAMRRTEKDILAEAAPLADALSRFPALLRVAADTKDAGFVDWLRQRLDCNKSAVLRPTQRYCSCGDAEQLNTRLNGVTFCGSCGLALLTATAGNAYALFNAGATARSVEPV